MVPNMAVVAPIPTARVKITMAVKPGLLAIIRKAYTASERMFRDMEPPLRLRRMFLPGSSLGSGVKSWKTVKSSVQAFARHSLAYDLTQCVLQGTRLRQGYGEAGSLAYEPHPNRKTFIK
jgi:hypothetical protein